MANAKIVIVDDDQDIVSALQATLEANEYDVVAAYEREEGMKLIKSEQPNLIILDVMMSTWQDGFEMARELKKNAESKNIPILMLTAVKDKTGINFKSTAGDPTWLPVDGFLDKPVESELLLSEVSKILSNKA